MSAEDSPGSRVIYEGALEHLILALILFGVFAIFLTLWHLFRKDLPVIQKYRLLVAWAIIPPAWFVLEYFLVFLPHGVKGSLPYFEYGQGIAAKLWAAMVALISVVLYTDKDKG